MIHFEIEAKDLQKYRDFVMIPFPKGLADALEALAQTGRRLAVKIGEKRKRRSLTANAALWQLIGEMAIALETSKDEIYIELLRKYGAWTEIPLTEEQAATWGDIFRIIEPLHKYNYDNRGKAFYYRVWPGTSHYNNKMFSNFLDRVIEEARPLGISLISEADKALLLEERTKEGRAENE